MSSSVTPSAIVVKEMLARYPNAPTNTLAKMLYDAHPLMFSSKENARARVRYYRGNHGNENRRTLKEKEHMRENGQAGYTPLPASVARPLTPYQIPEGKTLILSDIHIPYHDDKALGMALDFGEKYAPDNILFLGDMLDFFSASRFVTNPEERDLPGEINSGRQFLRHVRDRFPKARIIWKMGNHEKRWEDYLSINAPLLCGCDFVAFAHIFQTDALGIEIVSSRNKMKAGENLTLIHGHELKGSAVSPVSFARTMLMNMGVCSIGGHHHQTTQQVQKTADGVYMTAWSVGCLSDMSPEYAIINKWNHGLATLELIGNDFDVDNLRIFDDGKIK